MRPLPISSNLAISQSEVAKGNVPIRRLTLIISQSSNQFKGCDKSSFSSLTRNVGSAHIFEVSQQNQSIREDVRGYLSCSVADPGSRIPIRIRIKQFKYFNPKNYFRALGNTIRDVHPGSGSWFFNPSRIQGSKR
jgi:hypothetical protein